MSSIRDFFILLFTIKLGLFLSIPLTQAAEDHCYDKTGAGKVWRYKRCLCENGPNEKLRNDGINHGKCVKIDYFKDMVSAAYNNGEDNLKTKVRECGSLAMESLNITYGDGGGNSMSYIKKIYNESQQGSTGYKCGNDIENFARNLKSNCEKLKDHNQADDGGTPDFSDYIVSVCKEVDVALKDEKEVKISSKKGACPEGQIPTGEYDEFGSPKCKPEESNPDPIISDCPSPSTIGPDGQCYPPGPPIESAQADPNDDELTESDKENLDQAAENAGDPNQNGEDPGEKPGEDPGQDPGGGGGAPGGSGGMPNGNINARTEVVNPNLGGGEGSQSNPANVGSFQGGEGPQVQANGTGLRDFNPIDPLLYNGDEKKDDQNNNRGPIANAPNSSNPPVGGLNNGGGQGARGQQRPKAQRKNYSYYTKERDGLAPNSFYGAGGGGNAGGNQAPVRVAANNQGRFTRTGAGGNGVTEKEIIDSLNAKLKNGMARISGKGRPVLYHAVSSQFRTEIQRGMLNKNGEL